MCLLEPAEKILKDLRLKWGLSGKSLESGQLSALRIMCVRRVKPNLHTDFQKLQEMVFWALGSAVWESISKWRIGRCKGRSRVFPQIDHEMKKFKLLRALPVTFWNLLVNLYLIWGTMGAKQTCGKWASTFFFARSRANFTVDPQLKFQKGFTSIS